MSVNPIIRRFYHSQFRAQQFWVFGTVYVGMVLLLLFINSSLYQYGETYDSLNILYKSMFVQFAILEVFVLWLLCPANCSNVVSREIVDKSFDFFRMLPLSAAKKTVGILVGRNLFCLLVAGVNLIFCLIFAVAGELRLRFILQMLALLLSAAAGLNLLALMFSIISYRKNKLTSIPVLLVLGLFGFGPIIGILMDAATQEQIEYMTAHFFVFEMPLLYVISLCIVFAATWAYLGILRRFTYEYESLFSRSGAAIFVLSFLLLLLGLFYNAFLGEELVSAVQGFWMVGLLPVWVVPLLAVRNFDKYLEISRHRDHEKGLFHRLIIHSNIVSSLILFTIWFVFTGVICLSTGCNPIQWLKFSLLVLSFYLVIAALLEVHTLLVPRNEKIGFLLGFVGILYFFLPLILGGIFESPDLYRFSALSIIIYLTESTNLLEFVMPLIANTLWLALLLIVILKRYRDLIAIRSHIQKGQAA